MKRWNLRYSGNCLFCGYPDKDTNHILKCTHTQVTDTWKTLLNKYDMLLAKLQTSYSLRKAIILEIRAWRNNSSKPRLSFADTQLKQAILAQQNIGWRVFLEGLVGSEIIKYQLKYYQRNTPDKKINTWIKKSYREG